MKCVLFFAGVVLLQMVSTAYGDKAMLMACVQELGIPEDMLKDGPQVNRGKPEFRCLHACIMKKDGSLEPGNKVNGAIMKEKAVKHFGDKADTVFAAGVECTAQSTGIADECDFVNAISDCVLQKVPDIKNYFKP